MTMFGGKFLRRAVNKRVVASRELRDALVWDINVVGRYCRVKVQGSDKFITAYFPVNSHSKPSYVTPGNAVQICSPGGNRARVEVIGPGLLLPTPMGGTEVDLPDPGDGVLAGLGVTARLGQVRQVAVGSGSFQIAGVTYSTKSSYILGDGSMPLLGGVPAPLLGSGSFILTFAATSAGYYRYDLIVVDITGAPHIEAGTQFLASAPGSVPVPSADHVLIDWVLIHPGQTEITAADVHRLFSAPSLGHMAAVVADSELAWGESSTTITVTFRDQYGNLVAPGLSALTVTMGMGGTGVISGGTDSSHTTITMTPASSNTITYVRYAGTIESPELESSPMLTITAGAHSAVCAIQLYDSFGAVLYNV